MTEFPERILITGRLAHRPTWFYVILPLASLNTQAAISLVMTFKLPFVVLVFVVLAVSFILVSLLSPAEVFMILPIYIAMGFALVIASLWTGV